MPAWREEHPVRCSIFGHPDCQWPHGNDLRILLINRDRLCQQWDPFQRLLKALGKKPKKSDKKNYGGIYEKFRVA